MGSQTFDKQRKAIYKFHCKLLLCDMNNTELLSIQMTDLVCNTSIEILRLSSSYDKIQNFLAV